jgi:type VI secretion system secreted protein Hcp
MALNAYLILKGQKQGNINGSVTLKGRENTIALHAASHAIVTPRDPQSGLPTGQRMHKPFVVTKEIDKSSPLIYQAMVTNENLTSVQILYWAASLPAASLPAIPLPVAPIPVGLAGTEKQIYSITLTNANIAEIDHRMYNNTDANLANMPVQEEISFTYQKIQWTWADGSVTSGDDWEARV